MILSVETTKTLVVFLFILVVGPSRFYGAPNINTPVSAKDSEPNTMESEESNGSTTPNSSR